MNATLFQKVKNLCKDYGLSEKYLQATTEAIGGHIADDSTDTEEIEKVANQVAKVAAASQSEATRWAAKKASKNKVEDSEDEDEDETEDEDEDEGGKKPSKKSKKSQKSKTEDPMEARIKALEEKLAAAEAEKSKSSRQAQIEAALEKHKIPQYLRKRFAKSIEDDEDIEEVVSAYKQELITNGLEKDDLGGAKGASDKDTDSAAEDLLKTISVEQKQ